MDTATKFALYPLPIVALVVAVIFRHLRDYIRPIQQAAERKLRVPNIPIFLDMNYDMVDYVSWTFVIYLIVEVALLIYKGVL